MFVTIPYFANFQAAFVNHLSMYLNIPIDEKRKEAVSIKSREWKVDKQIQAHLNKKNNLKRILEDEICYKIILDSSIRNSRLGLPWWCSG